MNTIITTTINYAKDEILWSNKSEYPQIRSWRVHVVDAVYYV